MKNQYVADINDFCKYGLIRCLLSVNSISCGVFWMLTDADVSNDGNLIKYLDQPSNSEALDSDLFHKLRHLVHTFRDRTVSRIRQEGVLPRTQFVEDWIPDQLGGRQAIFQSGMGQLKDCQLIFFDPDNGLEVKTKPKGRKNSNKFLYLDEVKQAFDVGHSLLIYQHFPRIERTTYIASRVTQLRAATRCENIFSFSSGYVCFFLLLQPSHRSDLRRGIETVKERWSKHFAVAAH